MSKKASKTTIGIFVLGAVFLVIAAILILGSGKFFKQTYPYVMVFDGSVKGLNVGSPVVFRGVKIGSVSDIAMLFDPSDMTIRIAVYVELGEGQTRAVGPHVEAWRKTQARREDIMEEFIHQHGMKAQLESQSFVTGQLQIALDFHPDKPAKLFGVDPNYPEIPTIPMPLQEIGRKLQDLPIDEIAQKLFSSLEGIDNLVNSPELRESLKNLSRALEDVQRLVQGVENRFGPLATSIEETLKNYGTLAQNANKKIEPLASRADDALKAMTSAAKQADKALVEIQGLVGEDSRTTTELTKTLKELSAAARSIRIWADYLERHPEALIRGKGEYRR
jgi:paraquat-inducible protein B